MNSQQFKSCFVLAETMPTMPEPESTQAAIATAGCAYEDKVATKRQVAWLINYQSMMMNGYRDAVELAETRLYCLKHITLLD
jgi:hypothetical protein